VRYVIEDVNGETVSVEMVAGNVVIAISGDTFEFLPEEFNDFRKAVGYVTQEVEDK
jgi:hypothetical protein